MVAALEQRQMDQRHGRLAARNNHGAETFFQFTHFGGKLQRCGRAVKAIRVANPYWSQWSLATDACGNTTVDPR